MERRLTPVCVPRTGRQISYREQLIPVFTRTRFFVLTHPMGERQLLYIIRYLIPFLFFFCPSLKGGIKRNSSLPLILEHRKVKIRSTRKQDTKIELTTSPQSPPSQGGDFVVSLRRELRRTLSRTMKGRSSTVFVITCSSWTA